jgi:hypothetical protein
MKRHVASKHRIQSRRDLHAPQLFKIYGTKYKTLYAPSSKMSGEEALGSLKKRPHL